MLNAKFLSVLALPVLLSACAAPMAGDESSVKEEKVYITGSNLPQRGGNANVSRITKEEYEAMRAQGGLPTSAVPSSR